MKPDYEKIAKLRAQARKEFAENCIWCEEIETRYHVPTYDEYKFYQGVPTEEDY